ncbi:uncharacterized protein LOC127712464 [Mytilus californianus]|uniref:uncharacterized protein LOC127712464 n=1 Tax=Mytilus californianus TaxID=6549 RepID=UPI002245B916|nr:uncharacterized protein LOC127712464 [Mytilus californianus]
MIDRGWTIEELKAFVITRFPNHPLHLVDFKFARCKKGSRQEMYIIRPTSVAELAREIKAGKIYIIPMKQLPYTKDDNDPANTIVDDDDLPSLRSDSPYRQISGTDNESDSISVAKDDSDSDIPACSSTMSTLCPNCHRTVNEGQCIHCRQDQEYEQSLATDRERDRRSEERTSAVNRQQEEARKEEDRLQEIRNRRKNRLPIEPTSGIKLKFRTNSSWNDFTRSFLPSDEVNVLLNFVGSLDEATEHFRITFPQCEPIESVFQSSTISDMGIISNTLGRVTWLTEPKVSTTEPVTINKENNTLVLKAKTVSTFQKSLEKISSFLDYAGIDYFSCKNAEDAEILIQKAVHSYLFDRTSQALERFKSGLRTLGVMENIGSLKKLFLYENKALNRDTFEKVFNYCLSDEGSNDHQTETAIVSLWRDFLDDIEDEETDVTFQTILMFTTGSKTIPPLGFDPSPSVTFWKERFPKATTCTNTLVLPTLSTDYDSFVQNMKFGILNTQGFMLE